MRTNGVLSAARHDDRIVLDNLYGYGDMVRENMCKVQTVRY